MTRRWSSFATSCASASTGNVCLVATCRWDSAPSPGFRRRPAARTAPSSTTRSKTCRCAGSVMVRCRRRSAVRVGRALPAGPATSTFVRELQTYTGGNPLFVHAVLSDIPDDVVARLREGGLDPIPLGVPEDVQELLRKRRRRLSAPAQALLDVASVVGPAFQDDLVVTAAGVAEPAAAFAELRRAGLVRAGRAGGHQFTHALIHEAARRNLGEDERVRAPPARRRRPRAERRPARLRRRVEPALRGPRRRRSTGGPQPTTR